MSYKTALVQPEQIEYAILLLRGRQRGCLMEEWVLKIVFSKYVHEQHLRSSGATRG